MLSVLNEARWRQVCIPRNGFLWASINRSPPFSACHARIFLPSPHSGFWLRPSTKLSHWQQKVAANWNLLQSEMVRIWEVVVVMVVVAVEEENVDQGLFYSRGARDFYWETVCCLQFNLVFLGSNWNMQNLAKWNISGYWKPSLVLFHKSEDGCIAWKETAAVSFIETGRGGGSLRGMKLTFALGTISVCIKLREFTFVYFCPK